MLKSVVGESAVICPKVALPLDERVIGMDLHQLHHVKRSIGVAGGNRKAAAILGALRHRWINILITHRFSAERLIALQT